MCIRTWSNSNRLWHQNCLHSTIMMSTQKSGFFTKVDQKKKLGLSERLLLSKRFFSFKGREKIQAGKKVLVELPLKQNPLMQQPEWCLQEIVQTLPLFLIPKESIVPLPYEVPYGVINKSQEKMQKSSLSWTVSLFLAVKQRQPQADSPSPFLLPSPLALQLSFNTPVSILLMWKQLFPSCLRHSTLLKSVVTEPLFHTTLSHHWGVQDAVKSGLCKFQATGVMSIVTINTLFFIHGHPAFWWFALKKTTGLSENQLSRAVLICRSGWYFHLLICILFPGRWWW